MCVFHQLWFKPHKNFDFEVFSIYELNTPKYLTIFLVKAEVIIFSSPGHRPCELLSWVSVRPSVSFSHLNLLL